MMQKQYFNPKEDGFYGVYYPHHTGSDKAMIAMLGDSSDDRMVIAGVKWLHKRGCSVIVISPDKKDYGHHNRAFAPCSEYGKDQCGEHKRESHFVFPQSMLQMMLPVGSGLLVSLMFKAGREHPKECKQTRIDIDKRLTHAIRAW